MAELTLLLFICTQSKNCENLSRPSSQGKSQYKDHLGNVWTFFIDLSLSPGYN